MTIILQIIGAFFIVVGVIFSALGVVGILRLPDTYTRLHASGKTSTLGILFICFGTAFIVPAAILKLLALAIFIVFSGPVGSHAIAAAVHRGTNRASQELETAELESVAEEEDTKEPIAIVIHEKLPARV
jgi:multicomponent Na+:H+ antiporter subunit G